MSESIKPGISGIGTVDEVAPDLPVEIYDPSTGRVSEGAFLVWLRAPGTYGISVVIPLPGPSYIYTVMRAEETGQAVLQQPIHRVKVNLMDVFMDILRTGYYTVRNKQGEPDGQLGLPSRSFKNMPAVSAGRRRAE